MREFNTDIRSFISKAVAGSLAFTVLLSLSACSSTEDTVYDSYPDETSSPTTETTSEETTTEGPHDPYLKIKKETMYDKDNKIQYRYEYEYDQYGNEIKLTEIGEDNSKTEYVTTYKYNDKKQITVSEVSAFGRISYRSEYQYNQNGDVYKITSYAYNRRNNSLELYSTNEHVYDDNNNLIKINTYDSEGSLESYYEYVYDDKGQLISEDYYDGTFVENGFECLTHEEYEYDSDGKKIKTSSGVGSISYVYEYEYNSKGQVIRAVSSKLQYETEYEYDDKGNVIKEITYDNHTVVSRKVYEYTYG